MGKNRDITTTRPSDGFGGYASLLAQVKRRVLLAQRRAIYAANEEMLRMYWDIGELLQRSQKADGWGKSTLQRLANDMKNEFPEIKGFSTRILTKGGMFASQMAQAIGREAPFAMKTREREADLPHVHINRRRFTASVKERE